MSKIIDGKAIAKNIRDELCEQVSTLKKNNINVSLAVIRIGNDKASEIYVRNKKTACEKVGISSIEYALSYGTDEKEVLALIDKLNKDANINGILVQLPLPKHLSESTIINSINPIKDVDCFCSENVGKILQNMGSIYPCTPMGIMKIFERENINLSGKHCVIINRSNIVGKPLAMMLLRKNATVTVCHSKTNNISDITQKADIIIVAVGKAKYLKSNMVKENSVVIDVGINRNESDNKICGDADFEGLLPKVKKITTVPGGVGPMTVAMLLYNTVQLAKNQNNVEKL